MNDEYGMKKVVVVGASGKMGREVIRGIVHSEDISLVGAVDVVNTGRDVGELIESSSMGVIINPDLENLLDSVKPHVVIDFSRRDGAIKNIPQALKRGIPVVVGTTGLTEQEKQELGEVAAKYEVGLFIAPNFSLGAVMMMKVSAQLAKYFPQAEIIEYHNDKKVDSPSGTAIATARAMKNGSVSEKVNGTEGDSRCRGGEFDGVRVHSVRLKSMVAHQEVLFAGHGELLTIRHDSFSRESFIPGVLMAVRKVGSWQGLIVGLDKILD